MSVPKRFFVQSVSEETVLSGDSFNHAKNVLRLKEGDEVTLFDGSGKEYDAVIAKIDRTKLTLHTLSEHVSDKDPKADVYLLVGALKGDKTELVVQKATELGVTKIGVFSSAYSSAYMNENKLLRLERVAKEAAGQCLRSTVPEITYFEKFEEAVLSAAEYREKLFACEFFTGDAKPFPVSDSYALIVGSEGGFSKEEFSFAEEKGFRGISLGKRILRAETAAIALVSLTMYFARELQ